MKNKIPFNNISKIKNLYKAININNNEIYSYNSINNHTNYQKNNLVKQLIYIIFQYKYSKKLKLLIFQKLMLINNIKFFVINKSINLLDYHKNYSLMIPNINKNLKTIIYITYYKGIMNSKKTDINSTLNIFKYLISLSNKKKIDNFNSMINSISIDLQERLNNPKSLLLTENNKILSNNSITPNSFWNNFLDLLRNIMILNNQNYFSFSSINNRKISYKHIQYFLEYYLMGIYNHNVEIKMNELSKPYLDPSILGNNLAIYFSYKKESLRTKKSWARLEKILNDKIKISSSYLPKNFNDNIKDNSFISQNNPNKSSIIFKGNYSRNIDKFNTDNVNNNIHLVKQKIESNKGLLIHFLSKASFNKGNTNNNILYNKIQYILSNYIKFKSILGIHLSLSGRFSRRKIANRARTIKMYKGYGKYSVNNILNPFLKPKNNKKFNEDYIRVYTANRNGALCLKLKMSYTN